VHAELLVDVGDQLIANRLREHVVEHRIDGKFSARGTRAIKGRSERLRVVGRRHRIVG